MIEEIRKLISLLKEEDVDEIEIRRFWRTIRVVRRRDLVQQQRPAGTTNEPAVQPAAGQQESPPAREEDAGPIEIWAAEPAIPSGNLIEINSPMVGTFFRAPTPGAEPFVTEGSRVELGRVLCIIEAMKLMNEIESESSGVVRKVLVEDAQPVEFGQPLFLIESA